MLYIILKKTLNLFFFFSPSEARAYHLIVKLHKYTSVIFQPSIFAYSQIYGDCWSLVYIDSVPYLNQWESSKTVFFFPFKKFYLFIFKLFYFVSGYSWWTMLWQFQMGSEGAQPHTRMRPCSPNPLNSGPTLHGAGSRLCAAGPHWFPILNTAVCTCPSQLPNYPSPHPPEPFLWVCAKNKMINLPISERELELPRRSSG